MTVLIIIVGAIAVIAGLLTAAGFTLHPIQNDPTIPSNTRNMKGYRWFRRATRTATTLIIAAMMTLPVAVGGVVIAREVTASTSVPRVPIQVTQTSSVLGEEAYAEGVTPDGSPVLLQGIYQKGTTANLVLTDSDPSLGQTIYAEPTVKADMLIAVIAAQGLLLLALVYLFGGAESTATKYAITLRKIHRRLHPRKYATASIIDAAIR